MLSIEEIEDVLRSEPNAVMALAGQALLHDDQAMPLLIRLLNHEHTCGCERGGARLAEIINQHIRNHAETCWLMISASRAPPFAPRDPDIELH